MSCTICVRVLLFACVSRQLCRPYECHVATESMEKSYFSGSNFPPHKILKSHFCPQFISKFSPKVQNSIKNFQIHIFGNKIQNVAISSPNLGVKNGKYTPLITGLHSFTLYRRWLLPQTFRQWDMVGQTASASQRRKRGKKIYIKVHTQVSQLLLYFMWFNSPSFTLTLSEI